MTSPVRVSPEPQTTGPEGLADQPEPASRPAVPRLLHVFASFGYGGVPIRMARVISHLGPRYSHDIVALDGCLDSRSRIASEVDVRYRSVSLSKANPLQAVRQAGTEIAAIRPDLVMTYNWGAIEWAMAASLQRGCRQIHCESGFGVEEAEGRILRRDLFRRLALRRADAVIVPSRSLVEIATTSWRVSAARLRHIPNGVQLERFASPPDPAACARIGLPAGTGGPLVGTLAPLRPEKNVACLLRAFAQLPERGAARLAILGDGAERQALMALSEQLGIADRVVFAGHVEAVAQVLGAFDLFVLSSDTEQMPNGLIQAMAAGLPVAATAVGDVPAILAPENRPYLAPAGDNRQLAVCMAALLADEALRADLGRRNLEQARRHYDEGPMLERYQSLLDSCLGAARPSQ